LNRLHSNGAPDVFMAPLQTPQDIEYVRRVLENSDATLYIAQAGKEIVGLVKACIRESPPNIPVYVKRRYVYVDNICVLPEYRHTSIGKKLMEAIETWTQEKEVYQLEFNVWDFNKTSLAFFDSLGYEPRQHILGKSFQKNPNRKL
jgi:diamine N-acetyltransferase